MSPSGGDAHRARSRLLAATGLAALLGGAGLAVALALGSGDGAVPVTTGGRPAATTTSATPQPARIVWVPLRAVGAYDPEGDGRENDAQAGLAVDGDAATAWATERYTTFAKRGVGLVLDARRVWRLERVDVVSPTPGVAAEIRVGTRPTGPFRPAAGTQVLAATTSFRLRGVRARYVVVWITAIPGGGAAEVAEVRLRARRA